MISSQFKKITPVVVSHESAEHETSACVCRDQSTFGFWCFSDERVHPSAEGAAAQQRGGFTERSQVCTRRTNTSKPPAQTNRL